MMSGKLSLSMLDSSSSSSPSSLPSSSPSSNDIRFMNIPRSVPSFPAANISENPFSAISDDPSHISLTSISAASSSSFSASSKSVQFDFTELENEIEDMKRKKDAETRAEMELNAKTLSAEKKPFAALPSQSEQSIAFQSAVVESFGKARQFHVDPKKEFETRKAKRREQRRIKKVSKAHSLSEKKTVKLQARQQKKKNRNKAKASY
eukprot:TRINITY_DN1390_c0_g1_i1.p2 TRINITY_DN1390_c0_g1~~TRINITY_DN1390_c0_g1_i1.p2  ORF type:complete len:207 (-),score=50.91 TRINITY_DN1390_c0_g1_i1:353-973(-)